MTRSVLNLIENSSMSSPYDAFPIRYYCLTINAFVIRFWSSAAVIATVAADDDTVWRSFDLLRLGHILLNESMVAFWFHTFNVCSIPIDGDEQFNDSTHSMTNSTKTNFISRNSRSIGSPNHHIQSHQWQFSNYRRRKCVCESSQRTSRRLENFHCVLFFLELGERCKDMHLTWDRIAFCFRLRTRH